MSTRSVITFAFVLVGAFCAAAQDAEYETGGPLAGAKLPLWKTQYGEPPGHPGSLPDKMATAASVRDGQFVYTEWGPQGQAPEVELYPDAVEHYRAYMFKYMPIRSFFDKQSQR